jgi:hypothetical protein
MAARKTQVQHAEQSDLPGTIPESRYHKPRSVTKVYSYYSDDQETADIRYQMSAKGTIRQPPRIPYLGYGFVHPDFQDQQFAWQQPRNHLHPHFFRDESTPKGSDDTPQSQPLCSMLPPSINENAQQSNSSYKYNQTDPCKMSQAVHRAAQRGNPEMLQFVLRFISRCLDFNRYLHFINYRQPCFSSSITTIDEKDPDGDTSLHIAARNGHLRACEILCQARSLLALLFASREGELGLAGDPRMINRTETL